jgi:hypothetical protein
MTDLDDLPFTHDDGRIPNGAQGRPKCRRHRWTVADGGGDVAPVWQCVRCGKVRDATTVRRGRANRSRGNRAELDVARSIPGGRKMGPLGLPWDVEVGTYARLQVKKLAHRPSLAEIARLIERIPDTGDRLRGFVWVEAAGRGKRGQRDVFFLAHEFTAWHGRRVPVFSNVPGLVGMSLDEWVEEFVA